MNLKSHSGRHPADALIRYNNIVNKQTFTDNRHMVTHQNNDQLNRKNIKQRYIHRAIPNGEKPNKDKG